MKRRLKTSILDVDMICSQPSCPICNEDFVVDIAATKLPCSHLFHDSCVMPWLEMKQNCPICRAAIDGSRWSIEDVHAHFSRSELIAELRSILEAEKDTVTAEAHKKDEMDLYQDTPT